MGVFRLFLALSVLLGHTRGHGFFGLSFVYAEIAVQTFFMISGFYMALILNEKYIHEGRYKTFLTQRFLRLYPTYLILIVACVLVDLAVYGATGERVGSLVRWDTANHFFSPLTIAYFVIENLIILGQDIVILLRVDLTSGALHLFLPNDAAKLYDGSYFLIIGSSWSLAVEFAFYLIAPLLVCRGTRAQIIILALCFLVRAIIYKAVPYGDGYHWIYCLFPPNLFFFMAGSLSYVVYKNYQATLRAIGASKPWIIGLFAIFALDYCRFPGWRNLYLIWMPLVFVMVPLLFAVTSRSRLDRLIGELSYPCYLIHPHVLIFTVPLFSAPNRQWLLGPVSFAVTLFLCYLFYRFVESRTERFRESLYRKSREASYIQPPEARGAETPASTLN
jgi:peptidoglycan/LPS O-acetylase OafA/YrhL